MSKEGVASFIEKVLMDEAMQGKLKTEPEAVLSQFDLTAEERTAVTSGSEEQLKALGLDQRLSKLGLGGGIIGIG